MKYITLLTNILLLIQFTNAQNFEQANEEMEHYFKDKHFHFKTVEKSFIKFLKSNNIKYIKGEEHKAYYSFVSRYDKKWTVKASESAFEEFDKLELYTDRGFVLKFLEIFKTKSFYKLNEDLREIFVRLIEGPTSYQIKAYYLSRAFTPEDFKNPALQKFTICLIYSEFLPSEYTKNETILSSVLNKRLNEMLEKQKISESDIETCFKKLTTIYDLPYPGKINEVYFQLIDSALSKADKIKNSDALKPCLNKFKIVHLYPQIFEVLTQIIYEKEMKIKIWSPFNNVISMLDAVMKAGDVSPYLIMGGIKISFSNNDLYNPAYKKLYMLLSLCTFQSLIEENEQEIYDNTEDSGRD